MPLFESKKAKEKREKEEEKRNRLKRTTQITSSGLADKVDPKDYQKIIIEQNQTIIALLVQQAINTGGLTGGVFSNIHIDRYHTNIEKYLIEEPN